MISIKNLNKYYNKRKANEIHVINDTSLELPQKGLVALLGPSGCGKTTLLNAIGGLDKVGSGEIVVDGERITKRRSNKIDTIRNAKIGYIFQNFNLLDNKSVFENVAMALKMVGIKDKDIIKERTYYCLKAVGIYQFRNKPAGALSGGQRQRVAIARAIVKNPKIIIADEPTGNLDSANTIGVMNIIKQISKEMLVIMVTHEEKIATFYSDRIVRMKDGKIIEDYENEPDENLDYRFQNKIYLRDLKYNEDLTSDDNTISIFSDDKENLNIKLAVRGQNIYVDTGGKYNVMDENSGIELIDSKYTKIEQGKAIDKEFKNDEYMPLDFKPKYHSIYTWFNMLGNGFKTVKKFKFLKKLLLIGFAFAGAFSFLATSSIMGILNIEAKDFLTTNDHYVTVSNPRKSPDMADTISKFEGVKYAIPGNTQIQLTVPMDGYFQTAWAKMNLHGSVTLTSVLKKENVVVGEFPKNKNEIVIDKMIIDKFLSKKAGKQAGVVKPEHFIGRKIKVKNMEDLVISGISDTNSPSFFIDDSIYMNVLQNSPSVSIKDMGLIGEIDPEGGDAMIDEGENEENPIVDYSLRTSDIRIKTGRAPTKIGEVVVSESHKEEYELDKTIDKKLNGKKLKVVGFYKSDYMVDNYYVSPVSAQRAYNEKQNKVSAYTEDGEKLVDLLTEKGYTAKINYDRDKAAYKAQMRSTFTASLITAAVILAIALTEMYLMLRSSFLSRIKEVGILRAIGLKKKDIYKMFMGEIIVMTTITAIPGICLSYYVMKNVIKITDFLESLYLVEPKVAIISFMVIMVFNILTGLLPVFTTLRKKPAQILSRNDI